MQVSLTPESEAIFAEIMQAGAYDSPESLMADAVEALRQKIAYFDTELQKGIDQLERGETVPYNLEKIKALAAERVRKGLGYTRENSAALPPLIG